MTSYWYKGSKVTKRKSMIHLYDDPLLLFDREYISNADIMNDPSFKHLKIPNLYGNK